MADEKIIFSMVGVSKTFTNQKKVLNNIYLSFFYGAKIGIIGLNGSGKSTLMKIIAGIDKNYQGEVVFAPGYSVGYLEQEPQLDDTKTVKEIVEEGCASTVALLKEYEDINMKLCEPMSDDEMNRLIERQGELYEQIDHVNGWELDSVLERAMDALRCPDPDQNVAVLSGGERRRVALCRLLLQQPDVLLLDEPTNHLVAESIDPEKSVYEVISQNSDLITLGNRQIPSRAYVARFNFSGADQEKKCGMLSGGERNRLHLALALKEEGNVLLLDEPTNDIDVNTLRALEEGLENFAGCAVVISHDRWFLDRIATHILSFEGDSKVVFYEGSYSEYEEWKKLQGEDLTPKRVKYRKLTENQ